MASSSYCFSVLSLAVLLPFLLHSASATSYIDAICKKFTGDKAFCLKTLSAYPPAASATSPLQAGLATFKLAESYAYKTKAFMTKAAKEDPKLKKDLAGCQDAYKSIVRNYDSALSELKSDPEIARYDVLLCFDSTKKVKGLVGKNTDKASKTVIAMTMMMEKLSDISIGAIYTLEK
ncbi:hypothetical protein CARUB_v10027791mg [Capsella rubella]|uniref:Pectinesterase inhibitor domain-containing protein n=1 Tax=Capsella rubella TaxID=81985 RepID=R0GTT0_9BRAS|nr:uncharacterized protein LOC17875609 [Capsella rubella]EOA14553.1 hypothetical protein CARUB_v10027791mg [Capsella rubella]